MAQIVKRCDCPRARWGKCPHSWTVRWWADGRQHEQSFKRNYRAAAEHARAAEAAKLSIHRSDPPPVPAPAPIGLQDYAEQVWLPALERARPVNTVRAYRSALRAHVFPQHGRRLLTEVAADREGVQALLHAAPPGMERVVLTALRAMMTEAKASGRIADDRLTRLHATPAVPTGFRFPSHSQLSQLAAGLGELEPAVWIMRGCGLRPSEVLAVRGQPERPGGPGLSGGRLRVIEQQARTGTGRVPLKARRPGDFRDVPVPGYVTAALSELRPGYLFSVPSGTFRDRFRRAADAARLEGFRAHDLRHIFASVALAAGVPVTDVSRWLGHRSIQTTYHTYSHYIPSSFTRAIGVLDTEYRDWSAG
jgi:integrase